jgi:hypothetical protein
LEQKLFNLQEELTDLHRRKGENAQQIIDLNNALQEKEKILQDKGSRYILFVLFTLGVVRLKDSLHLWDTCNTYRMC